MKIHCSGIGGIGLSAYAALQKIAGHDVSGSDRTESALLRDLRSQGIAVSLDQSGGAIPEGTELFVYSEAIPKDAPERTRAQELGIRQLSYPQAVGELSHGKKVIAVCGTHGKSSTTGMAARVLLEAGLDPTIIVGTKLRELDGRNWRTGKSDLFLLEACEYKHSFLSYDPSIILLTNCDGDHFDFYPSVEAYRQAFKDFARKLRHDGALITHRGDPDCEEIASAVKKGVTVIDADKEPVTSLATPGAHMRANAQLVLALAKALGIDATIATKSLSGYAGSWRRMEKRGTTAAGIPVIDDYGHHPKEIRATLQAMREAYPESRVVCVFQPHTHDRTRKLFDDFASAFSDADAVIIPNIYEARRQLDAGTTVEVSELVSAIAAKSGVDAVDGHSLAETQAMLPAFLKPGDLLVCMGAGDVTSLASAMVSA